MKDITPKQFFIGCGIIAGLMAMKPLYHIIHMRDGMAKAEERAAQGFKNPDTVKFKDTVYFENQEPDFTTPDITLCGEVNAMNSFGAYTGFRPFMFQATPVTPDSMRVETDIEQQADNGNVGSFSRTMRSTCTE